MVVTGILKKFKAMIISIAAVIISIGSWNDTETVLVNTYQKIKATWTNENEYLLISKITVGHSFDYVKLQSGLPQAVKSSSIDSQVQFNYFNYGKFMLSVAVKESRVAAYSIQALNTDFSPSIPYVGYKLFDESLKDIISSPDDSHFESGSSNYYIDVMELGRDAMFHQLMVGMYNYNTAQSISNETIQLLDQAYVLGDDASFNQYKNKLRENQINTFTVSELPRDVMLEMMLTKFEFNTYFS
ncbi:hypothetical protein BCU70_02200 [Vibrio sp. 10N.286.49.C2]|nr:hypothetical protein BCU70_02200 [Vibrio sp. 10N.286.49.C2]PMH53679.1 hypothetical protein BCU66_12635 [Vibrio sp. 10N.286.49.B1]PMH82608.1 hypothetical protein BCU58_17690 [Vibrio sp. 10N.286.48.B7]